LPAGTCGLEHEGHETNDEYSERVIAMPLRIPSPFPPEFEALVSSVIDGALDVHNFLGPGLLEAVYADAMVVELTHRGLKFERERYVTLSYRGKPLRSQRLDLVVEEQILLELKAVERLMPVHKAQAAGYLRASGLKLALLINFNCDWLRGNIKRIIV
jgi:GxxExxY protein